ncbi:unnamed protein product [Peniophora sp. CBMAI 1063]|nr:unnamed protein product [Peniophora sp. CBMAI 1063]
MAAGCDSSRTESQVEWVPASGYWQGIASLNAIKGGREVDGRALYVARATHQGGIHPGKTDGSETHFSYGGMEIRLYTGYELLVGPRQSLRWVAISGRLTRGKLDGAIPVRAGNEADGTPLFSARASMYNGVHIGKVKFGGNAHVPYGGRERFATEYDVLVHT